MKKKIGFFGHSAASWIGSGGISFIDLLADEFVVVCKGVNQGSEERTLIELKRTPVDVAVIFHSSPHYFYLPHCDRDISTQQINLKKATHLFAPSEVEDSFGEELEDGIDEEFGGGNLKAVFKSAEVFFSALALHKKYLWSNDLAINRFAGAAMQIDSFLLAKGIFAIHVYEWLPPWVSFRSGVISRHLQELTERHYQLGMQNNISAEGNRLMAEALRPMIRSFFAAHPSSNRRRLGRVFNLIRRT